MNIQKILIEERRYDYVDRVQGSLSGLGFPFCDTQEYGKAGSTKEHVPSATFKQNFGKDAKLPEHQDYCLCGHYIREQCYLCPPESDNVDDIIVVGNHCIRQFGFEPALRGKLENNITCDLCGALVTWKGIARHEKTSKCKNNNDTSSTPLSSSTSIGSDQITIEPHQKKQSSPKPKNH
jgi:hypothetical protein